MLHFSEAFTTNILKPLTEAMKFAEELLSLCDASQHLSSRHHVKVIFLLSEFAIVLHNCILLFVTLFSSNKSFMITKYEVKKAFYSL
jgi:hypothetical protein